MMAMFGGGTAAGGDLPPRATDEMTITLSPTRRWSAASRRCSAGIAAMGGGKPMRIQRTEFANNEGELQGVVDGKVMVSVAGDATVEDKTAYLEAMDFKGLAGF